MFKRYVEFKNIIQNNNGTYIPMYTACIYLYFIRMMGDAKKQEVVRYNVAVAIYFRGCGGHVPLCGKSFYFSPPGEYNIYKRLATAVP